MKRLLATMMLLAALPAPAFATPGFCEDLRLAIAALRPQPEAPARYALFRNCRRHVEDFTDEMVCAWRPDSSAPAVEGLAAEALRCLPGARRADDPARAGTGEARLAFELLTITIGQDGAPGGELRLVVSVLEG